MGGDGGAADHDVVDTVLLQGREERAKVERLKSVEARRASRRASS